MEQPFALTSDDDHGTPVANDECAACGLDHSHDFFNINLEGRLEQDSCVLAEIVGELNDRFNVVTKDNVQSVRTKLDHFFERWRKAFTKKDPDLRYHLDVEFWLRLRTILCLTFPDAREDIERCLDDRQPKRECTECKSSCAEHWFIGPESTTPRNDCIVCRSKSKAVDRRLVSLGNPLEGKFEVFWDEYFAKWIRFVARERRGLKFPVDKMKQQVERILMPLIEEGTNLYWAKSLAVDESAATPSQRGWKRPVVLTTPDELTNPTIITDQNRKRKRVQPPLSDYTHNPACTSDDETEDNKANARAIKSSRTDASSIRQPELFTFNMTLATRSSSAPQTIAGHIHTNLGGCTHDLSTFEDTEFVRAIHDAKAWLGPAQQGRLSSRLNAIQERNENLASQRLIMEETSRRVQEIEKNLGQMKQALHDTETAVGGFEKEIDDAKMKILASLQKVQEIDF